MVAGFGALVGRVSPALEATCANNDTWLKRARSTTQVVIRERIDPPVIWTVWMREMLNDKLVNDAVRV